jgi:hypothetical protein
LQYRAFHIAPRDEQYVQLQNRPYYPLTFDPTKPPSTPSSPPTVVRIPLQQATIISTKKPKKIGEPKVFRKKVVPELDVRSQQVKSMMKQAQKQAQLTQAQLLGPETSIIYLISGR